MSAQPAGDASANTHRCPADGCVVDVPFHMLACAPHWRLVSSSTKREVYSAWQYGTVERHTVARALAVEEMNARIADALRRKR
jgi:hypothetical protein